MPLASAGFLAAAVRFRSLVPALLLAYLALVPLAEQQFLFLFAATGSTALYALPQYVSELAILVAVYGAARRLGFGVRPSACASFTLATFTLVALQATTAQNDLAAAAFPIVAA